MNRINLSFLLFFVTVLFFGSCTVTRDRNAFTRVINNNDLLQKSYDYYNSLHPVVEPKPVIIKGKDTTIYSTDTLIIDRVKDSLIKIACPQLNLDSLRKANTIVKYVDHYRVDTLPVLDTTCQRKYNLSQYNVGVLSGKNEELNTQLLIANKKSQNKLWWLIGAGVIILGLIYLLFKKK